MTTDQAGTPGSRAQSLAGVAITVVVIAAVVVPSVIVGLLLLAAVVDAGIPLGYALVGELAVGAVLALVAVRAIRRLLAYGRVVEWARANGWTLAPRSPALLPPWTGYPFGAGHRGRTRHLMWGRVDDRPAVSFTYLWADAVRMGATHAVHVVAVELRDALPLVEVTPQRVAAAEVLGGQDIDFESAEFNDTYRVVSPDPRFAHAILHPRLLERLLRADAVGSSWRVDGSWIVSWEHGLTDVSRVLARLGLLSDIAGSIPTHVWQDAVAERRPALRSADLPDLREAR